MAEYIDKEKLIADIVNTGITDYKTLPFEVAALFIECVDRQNEILEIIERQPAAEVEPVRHGRWIVQKCECISTTFECSECGRTVDAANDYFANPTEHIAKKYPYCHCGARTDGGADGAN